MSSPDRQLEVLRLQQERLREERVELAEKRSQLNRREKDIAIEESFRDVDKIVPVRDGESFIADGDAENNVVVSCEKTKIGFNAIQRSRGLILEARNLASCTSGTFSGGDEIGKAGKFDLGWTVFRPGAE